MRIAIRPSAHKHLIGDAEIRAVVGFPALRVALASRRRQALPVLFVGPVIAHQPWIEVIADLVDPSVVEVFHAMMLRRSLVESLGLDRLIDPDYSPQRA